MIDRWCAGKIVGCGCCASTAAGAVVVAVTDSGGGGEKAAPSYRSLRMRTEYTVRVVRAACGGAGNGNNNNNNKTIGPSRAIVGVSPHPPRLALNTLL